MRRRVAEKIWEREYHGFEAFYDYWRDVEEAVDPRFNPKMKGVPGEFQGTLRVTITYEAPEQPGGATKEHEHK